MGARNRQNGAVAPLIAVLLLVIVVCVAFVVDLGHIHNVKVELQRAVDAAALAAAKQLPNGANVDTVARAVAATNTVDNAPVPVDAASLQVEMGLWRSDTASLGLPASDGTDNCTTPTDRWNSSVREDLCGAPPNAVLVRATRDVQHAFFFFVNDTEVIADAIALAKPVTPILPLTMVSCIPTDATTTHVPGTLPQMNICGVIGHNFNAYDLAAWSSLTFGPASEQNILEILKTDGVFERFNQVVFGQGLSNTNGIENDPVSTSRPGSFNFDSDYAGCINDGLNIKCGLGRLGDMEVAPPKEFDPPAGIPPLHTAINAAGHRYYTGDVNFDPLAAYQVLPRWYNIDDNDSSNNEDGIVGNDGNDGIVDQFDADDHFIRVVTQDGILLRSTETPDEFKQRMNALKDGSLRPYGADDDRFLEGNFIDNRSRPDYLAVARYAGYPRVHVMNGVTKPVMEAFLMRVYGTDDKKDIQDPLPCSNNTPFPAGEKSIRVNVPVIFAGNCETWSAVDSSKFVYIGMAKFLMTRAELTNVMYACLDGEQGYAGSCTETFSPPLDGEKEFGQVSFNAPALIEGLYTLPTFDDDDQGGQVDVFLVE